MKLCIFTMDEWRAQIAAIDTIDDAIDTPDISALGELLLLSMRMHIMRYIYESVSKCDTGNAADPILAKDCPIMQLMREREAQGKSCMKRPMPKTIKEIEDLFGG